jgi:EmrB/QacA subfamily drug resistance transporter
VLGTHSTGYNRRVGNHSASGLDASSLGAPARFLRLGVVCTAPLVLVLDTTIVTVALPTIAVDLGFSDTGVGWVLTGYALVFGGLLLLGGRLGDLLGNARMFRLGFLTFAAASILGGLAFAPWVLLVARALQGAGAAAVMPASLALVSLVFPDRTQRNRALGIYSGTAAVGGALGVVLGGVLTEYLGWRWVMFAVVPLALPALTFGHSIHHDSPRGGERLDVAGAVTVTAGLASLLYALTEGPVLGWASPPVAAAATAGLVLLGGFLVVEHRSSSPLLPLSALRVRAVAVSNIGFLIRSGNAGYALVLTMYLQRVIGLSPVQTGLCFVPLMLAAMVAAPISGRSLVPWLAPRTTSVVGMVIQILGLALMALAVVRESVIAVILGSVVWAAGKVAADVAMTITATESLRGGDEGIAAGLASTSQQLGAAWGFAAAAAILGANPTVESTTGPTIAFLANAGFIAVALALVLVALPRPSTTAPH